MTGGAHRPDRLSVEDLVQEVFLRARRAYGDFERRASVRAWLYRIATGVCLDAVEGRARRPLPTGLGPAADPSAEVAGVDLPWLEPVPDALVGVDPRTVVTTRESVRLTFVAALQHLSPRQRAVLVLREVLQWPAVDVARMLDTSTAAVNSLLQRARGQLDRVAPRRDEVVEPAAANRRPAEYVAAWERADVAAIVAVLTVDASWEMPPLDAWYRGRDDIVHHLRHHCPVRPGQARLVPVAANGQPAFATYAPDGDGCRRAAFLQVLTLADTGIRTVHAFLDVRHFASFGLPPVLP
ncbi:RNA polymerase subunit sigma-70 [Actinosynnema sp. NPDC047251]|uniref:RNA polymerase subunit sigma-70 n=1 Tax=Saccharothrix espanaensis TaxID=103731 RepID=UPI0022B2203C|nr:RNA polymerase subunit sigma-70 [Saccharothrix espanaensis]